jgi:ADP-ribose pyrophosphatase YjhB (NUDIX family)
MTKVLYGERLGKNGELRIGCSATIFDASRQKVLLTRRADNGLWCLPGGHMEPGESLAECCAREVLEETGLGIRVTRLTGVYSNPDQLVVYPDGSQAHFVVMNFEAEILGGELGLMKPAKQAISRWLRSPRYPCTTVTTSVSPMRCQVR